MDRARRRAFGARVARLRKQADLTQEELAERAGFAASSIARVELGTRLVSLEKLFDLAEGLDVTPARLLADERTVATEGGDLWGRAAQRLANVTLEMSDADIELLTNVALRLRDASSRRR